jgi:hypothetical protein
MAASWRILIATAALAAAIVTTGCGDGGENPSEPPIDPTIAPTSTLAPAVPGVPPIQTQTAADATEANTTEADAVAAEPTPCAEEATACTFDLPGLPALNPQSAPVASLAQPVSSAPSSELSPIPLQVAALSLISDDASLRDLRLDGAAARLYLTDSAYRLYVIDAASLALIETHQTTGDLLTLDAANGRLYIAPRSAPAQGEQNLISIYDIASGSLLDQTLTGGRVTVDSARNRLYVGDVYDYTTQVEQEGVRLYDAATLERLAQSTQPGAPVYNPVSDLLLILAYTAYTADPETLEVRADLFPDISATDLIGCNGCPLVADAVVFPDEEVVAFNVITISPGKGPGVIDPPRLLNARSMVPEARPFEVAETCSSLPALNGPIGGRLYDHQFYSRYMVHNNWVVTPSDGSEIAFRDGLGAAFFNPHTGVAYVDDGWENGLVLDLESMTPLATLPRLCFAARDSAAGRLYALAPGNPQAEPWTQLLALEERGGAREIAAAEPTTLAGKAIREILPSPDYASDATLFLRTWDPGDGSPDYPAGEVLLRSSDGGETWLRLRGGLPEGSDLALAAALSPAFAQDNTLFAGGARGDYAGEGVWVSRDRGDTWSQAWGGLEHLRVNRLVLSPRFAADATLLAYARLERIEPWQSGSSLHRSTDGGVTWTTVMTTENAALLPAPSAWLPITKTVSLPVRKGEWQEPVQVQLEGGAWVTATASIGLEEYARAVLTAPDYPTRNEIYVVTNAALYRTLDGGVTWQVWDDPRLAALTLETEITSAAVTPILADGSYRLLIGTAAGELWAAEPSQMTWTAVADTQTDRSPADSAPALEAIDTGSPAAAPPPVPTTTPAPTATVAPTATQSLTSTAPVTPSGGLFQPEGALAAFWQGSAELQAALGMALSKEAATTPAAYQLFENGTLVWRGDLGKIYAILNDGTWSSYADTFREGDMERDPNIYTPGELLQPERGFGKVWRENDALREQIGWALAKEKADSAIVQSFERGEMVRVAGRVYSLLATGQWK